MNEDATTEKAARCERCDYVPGSGSDETPLKDGLCHDCDHVMSFAAFVQSFDPPGRWQALSDLFVEIEGFDELDAERAEEDTAEAASIEQARAS